MESVTITRPVLLAQLRYCGTVGEDAAPACATVSLSCWLALLCVTALLLLLPETWQFHLQPPGVGNVCVYERGRDACGGN